jgi:hypothetical protein
VWQVIPSPVSDANKSVTICAQHPNPFSQFKQAGQTHKITTENNITICASILLASRLGCDFFFVGCMFHNKGSIGQPYIFLHDQPLTTLLNFTAGLATNRSTELWERMQNWIGIKIQKQ